MRVSAFGIASGAMIVLSPSFETMLVGSGSRFNMTRYQGDSHDLTNRFLSSRAFQKNHGINDRSTMYRSVRIGNLRIHLPHLTDELPCFRNSGNVETGDRFLSLT